MNWVSNYWRLPIQDEITGALQILAAVVPFRDPDWIGDDRIVAYELATLRRIWSDALPPRQNWVETSLLANAKSTNHHPFCR